jgi:hypothetical protein
LRCRPGLTITIASPTIRPDALAVSPGVEALAATGGVVARPEWRPLDRDDREVVFSHGPVPLCDSVVLIDMGDELVSQAHEELLPLVSGAAFDQSSRAAALRRFHGAVLEVLATRLGLVPEQVGAADLVAHRPGLRSTAHNPESGAFMGLHVDSHQRLPFGDRWAAMTLCAVNVGFTHRDLNLVNLAVPSMVEMLEESGHAVSGESANDLRDAFFAAFPDYPVLRVRLQPGQAYLCNTQNTVHDGATNDEGLPDLSFLTLNELPVRTVVTPVVDAP